MNKMYMFKTHHQKFRTAFEETRLMHLLAWYSIAQKEFE